MGQSFVPVNYSVENAHAAAGLTLEMAVPDVPIPAAGELDNWAQESYSLDVSAATSLGFPVGNLSGSAHHQTLLFGVARWKDVTVADQSYRFGVALRALIVVSDIKGDGALTLPIVAAKVELEGARASAQMFVRGYKGTDLAASLPTWQTFGVDSYAEYMKAISDIQKLILSNEAGITPELLATTALSSALPSPAAAAGSVYALHAIADGIRLGQALEHLRNHDGEMVATAQAVYRDRVGDEWTVPNDEQRAAAAEQLYGLHLSHQLPWQRG